MSIFGSNKKLKAYLLAAVASTLLFNHSEGLAQEISLTVSYVDGGNSLNFGRLRNLEDDGTPKNESSTRQLRLLITPASGNTQPYIVTQILSQDPVQERGTPVVDQSIRYTVQEETGAGTVRVPDETPLVSGEEEIYRSSPSGGTSQLLITFDLTASSEQEAGNYEGIIDYRVSLI